MQAGFVLPKNMATVAREMQQFLISGNGLTERPDDSHKVSRRVAVVRRREQKKCHHFSDVLSLIQSVVECCWLKYWLELLTAVSRRLG